MVTTSVIKCAQTRMDPTPVHVTMVICYCLIKDLVKVPLSVVV